MISSLADDESLASLQPSELEELAVTILLSIQRRFEDRLSELGNETLSDMMTFDDAYQGAEAKAAERDHAVSGIVTSLEARGVDPQALDDLVHDCADAQGAEAANSLDSEAGADEAIDAVSVSASEVNNEGISSQVSYLIAQLGAETAKERIEAAAMEWLAAQSAPKNG